MKFKHNKGWKKSAKEVSESVDDTSDEKEDFGVEALVGVSRIGLPGCLERTFKKISFNPYYTYEDTKNQAYWHSTQDTMAKRTWHSATIVISERRQT